MTLFAAIAVSSWAQTFVLQDDQILTDAAAPSVVYDGARYLMAFETPATTVPAGCSEAWSIGRADSSDGIHFTKTNASVLGVLPFAPCGARAPGLARMDDGRMVLVFEAVQLDGSVRVGVVDRLGARTRARVLPDLDGLLQPSIARFDGTWRVLAVDPGYGLVTADSTDLVHFVVDRTTVTIGATPWSSDGIETAALGCWDEPQYPFEAYYGGWSGSETGWAHLVESDRDDWYVTAPYDLWSDDTAWGGWDFVTDGTRTAVYFDRTDPYGVRSIGVTLSGGAFPDPAALRGRDCHS